MKCAKTSLWTRSGMRLGLAWLTGLALQGAMLVAADDLESSDTLVWSSQSSTRRTGKKGRELLDSLESDTKIEVWLRGRKRDPFTYGGWAVLISAEGEKPIRIKWRLLDPLPDDEYRRLSGSE